MDIDHSDSVKTVENSVVVAAVEAEVDPEKKRTTLAELFMEDQDHDTKHDKEKQKNPNLNVDGQKVKYHKQNGSKLCSKFTFAKRMVTSKSKDKEQDSRPTKKVHDSRPIKKVHQVIFFIPQQR